MLDELDKAEQSRQYDPLAALYTLLEPRSARTFTDLSIRDFSIDASHVNWIATANSIEAIPAPILSRMTVLHVRALTPTQVRHIAQSIYGRMRAGASRGGSFAPHLDEPVLNALKGIPPRTIAIVLRRALGHAARVRRDRVIVSDIPAVLGTTQHGIGFMANVSTCE